MFGLNPVAPIINRDSGQVLRVVKGSPFSTIQGEGPYVGTPAIFIRLHGCNLRCTFCDTMFSDETDPERTVEWLLDQVRSMRPALVVITGGEPLRQNILPLCKLLSVMGRLVQVETAGTLWLEGLEKYAKIVVSPKTPTLHPGAYEHATAFKYIVDVEQDFYGYIPITATQPGARPTRLAEPRKGAMIYLSPMDTGDIERNHDNLKLVARLSQEYLVTAGIQLHKVMGLD